MEIVLAGPAESFWVVLSVAPDCQVEDCVIEARGFDEDVIVLAKSIAKIERNQLYDAWLVEDQRVFSGVHGEHHHAGSFPAQILRDEDLIAARPSDGGDSDVIAELARLLRLQIGEPEGVKGPDEFGAGVGRVYITNGELAVG